MSQRSIRGRRGEELAAAYLRGRGWRILARNYRAGHQELDLVAARGGVLAFVEVKTRGREDYGHPLEAITRRKRSDLARAARHWLRTSGYRSCLVRFDAVAVIWPPGGEPRLEHVEDAWRLG